MFTCVSGELAASVFRVILLHLGTSISIYQSMEQNISEDFSLVFNLKLYLYVQSQAVLL